MHVALRGAVARAAVASGRGRPPPPCELLTGCRGDVRDVTAYEEAGGVPPFPYSRTGEPCGMACRGQRARPYAAAWRARPLLAGTAALPL